MNKIYKVIFNRNKNRYEIVSELASSRGGKCKVKAGKQIAKLFMTGLLATFLSSVALAAEKDAKIVYDPDTKTIKILDSTNPSTVLASYVIDGQITSSSNNLGNHNIILGSNASANPNYAVSDIIALGTNSTATQSSSIAIGQDAHAGNVNGTDNSNGKIAIGTKTVASGDRSIALGNYSTSNKGSYNIVQGDDSIGIGTSTSVFGYSGVSIGRRNIIGIPYPQLVDNNGVLTTKSNTPYREADPGGNSVIVGAYNVAYGNRSSIVGTYSRAMGSNSVAIGSGVQSLSDGAIAIGKGSGYEFSNDISNYARYWELPPEYKVLKQVLTNDIQGDEKYKKGRKTLPKYDNYGAGSSDPGGFIVEGENALGIGTYTQVRGNSAIGLATGEMTADLSLKDKSKYAIAMKQIMDMEETLYEAKEKLKAEANNGDKEALESAVKAAEESLANAKKEFREKYLGSYSFVEGEGALGVGRQILAQGDRSMAVGDYAKAISNDAIAYGGQTLANGTNSMAMGGNAHVGTERKNYDNSMAIGSHTNVQAGNAVALGAFTQVEGENSLALGFGKQANDSAKTITYNTVTGSNSTLIGSYSNVAGSNSILIGSSGSIANDRVVGLGNNINIAKADPNDQKNNTAGSVFLGDHAGYVKDSERARSLGKVTLVGSEEKKELTESLSSTKGALRDYTKDFIYIYMLENQDDGTKIGAPIAVRSDFAGGDSTVGVVSVGSTYEQKFKDLTAIKDYHTKVGSLITVPVEVEVEVKKNGIKLGKQNQTRYFAADSTEEAINADNTLSEADKKKVWNAIQAKTSSSDSTYTVFETRRIQNVAPGLIGSNSTDAINGSQLFATNQMLGNLVGSLKKTLGDNVTITPDGQIGTKDKDTPFTLGWFAKAGSVEGSNGTVAYEVDRAENEKEEDNKAKVDNLKSTGYVVDAAKTMTFKAGKNIGLVQKPGELSISTIDTPSFKSVELRGETQNVDGKKVTEVTKIDSNGMKVVTETSTPASDGGTTPTVTEKVSTTVGKDGVSTDGSVKVTNGKDGDQAKDLVTIGKNVDPNAPTGKDGENGIIGLDGKNGSEAVITIDRGTKSMNDKVNLGTDPSQAISDTNTAANMDRITYTTKGPNNSTINHEVATLDDGFFLTTSKDVADQKAPAGVKLNHTIKFTDGANTKVSTVTSTDGVHELHVDVNGLPMSYVDNQGKPLTKIGDTFYRTAELVDGKPPAGAKGVPDTEVTSNVTMLDKNGKNVEAPQIKNVGSGLVSSNNKAMNPSDLLNTADNDPVLKNAVNAGDLKQVAAAVKTEVTGTGKAIVTKKTGDKGQNIYNVHVDPVIDVVGADGSKVVRGGDGKYYNPTAIQGKTFVSNGQGGGSWYNDDDVVNGAPKENATPQVVAPADVKNSFVNPNSNDSIVLDNVKSGIGGEVQDPSKNKANTFLENVNKVGAPTNGISENVVVNAKDLKNLVDTGFKLNTSGQPTDPGATTVKIGDTINVVDGANTKVSAITAEDGTHTFHIDVTGMPISYTDNQGNALTKIGDKYYKNTDITDGVPNKNAVAVDPENVTDNIKVINKDGNTTNPGTISNVKSAIDGVVGNGAPNGSTINGEGGTNTFIDNVNRIGADTNGIDKNSVVTTGDLKNLADTPLFFSGDAADGKEYNGTKNTKNTFGRKLSEEAKIVGGQTDITKLTDNNIGVVSNGTDTLTIKLAKELQNLTSVTTGSGDNKTVMNQAGVTITSKTNNPDGTNTNHSTSITKDGVATDGTIKVTNGKDGQDAKDLVTIGKGTETDPKATDKEFGTVVIDGKNGSNATLTVDRGTKSVTDSANVGKNPTKPIDKDNPAAGMDRLTYTTTGADGKSIINHEVATLDDGFFLTTEHTEEDKTRTVLFNNTIKVLDGANTKVSAMGGEDGTHTFSIDVTGLPMTYTATDANGKTQDVHKVGDTYTLADGTKLVQVGDKFYKPDQVQEVNGKPQVKADQEDKDTKLNNISLTSPVANTAPTLSNVGSALKKSDGARITMSDLDDSSVYPTNNPIWNNAVNVGDLKAATDAARTEVTGTGEAFVTRKQATDGHTIYNVHVDKILSHKDAAGNELVRGGDGKYYTNEEIKDKTYIPSENKWYSNRDITDGKPNKDAQAVTPNPVDQSNVKTSLVNPNAGVGTGTDTSMTLDNVKSGIGGDAGNGIKDGTTVDGTQGNNTFIKNLDKVGGTGKDAIDKTTVVNAGDLKNLADTPLFFSGDVADGKNGNVKNTFGRKLSEEAKIVGGVTTPANLTDNNIGVVSNGSDTLTIKLAKQLTGLDSATYTSPTTKTDDGDTTSTMKVDGNGIRFVGDNNAVKTDAPSLTTDGITGGNKQIINVGSGLKDGNTTISISDLDDPEKMPNTSSIWNNAVNVGDLKKAKDAATTEVTGTGKAIVTKTVGNKGQNIYNVHVDPVVDVVATDGKTQVVRGDDGKYYNPTDIADKTFVSDGKGGGSWYNKSDIGANGKPNTGAPVQNISPVDVKNNFVNPNGTGPIVLDNVKSGIGGEVKDAAGNNTFIDNINKVGKKSDDGTAAPNAISENTVVNAKDLKNVVDTGFKLNTSGQGTNPADTVKVGDTIQVVDGKNTTVSAITNPTTGVHEFHIDVTGLPVTYTATEGENGQPVDVSKVGDTYQLADGTKLVNYGDKFYKPNQIVNGQPVGDAQGFTINDDIRLVNPNNGTGPVKITNVAPGVGDTDAVNMSQLKNLSAGSKTEVTGTGAAEVTKKTAKDGHDIYNVHVDKLLTVKPVTTGTAMERGADGKYYAPSEIQDKTFVSDGNGGGSWYAKDDVDEYGTPLDGKSPLAQQPTALDPNTLKTSVTNPNGNGPTIVDNVKSVLDGSGIGNGADMSSKIDTIENGKPVDTAGSNQFIKDLTGLNPTTDADKLNSVSTVSDLQKVALTPLFFEGDTAKSETTNNAFGRKLSEKAKIVGGQKDVTKLTDNNIGVVSNGSDTLTVKLAKELQGLTSLTTIDETDGTKTIVSGKGVTTNGKVVVNNGKTGDEAKELVTIDKGTDGSGTDKEYGKIGLDGKNGSNATITIDRGTKSLNDDVNIGVDPSQPVGETNESATMDRITYSTTGPNNTVINHEVATLDDGFFLTTSKDVTDNKAAAKVKLNNTIKFTDGANTKVSTVDSKDGIHELHVDVTGLPVTYTASELDDNGKPTNTQNVSKIGDTYQLEDGTKLVKVDNKYYTPDQLENGTPKPGVKGLTIDNSIRVINPEQPNNSAKITNVAPGEADTDAVNMSQLKQQVAAATTEVTGTGAAEVTKVTGSNGQNIYNVHVDKLMTVKPVDANSTIARGGDGKYYNAGDIAGKTFVSDGHGGGNWYDANDVDQATGKPKIEDDGITPKQPLADQPQAVDQNTLKNSVVNPNGNGPTVLDNVKSGIGGDAGNGIKNGSTIDGTTGNNTFIENLDKVGKPANEGGIDKTTVVNAGDLKNLADTPLFFSGDSADGVVAADGTDKNTFSRKLSQETKIVGGVNLELQDGATAKQRKEAIAAKLTDGNIGVISDGTDTLTIKLAKELKDLASVKVSNGKDGKNLVTIGKEVDDKAPAGKDGENGFIGLDGKNGSEAVITIDRGTKSITDEANLGKDLSQPVSGTNKSANMDRITYTTKGANGDIDHEVATLDDGFMLTTSTDVANSKAPANVKLNNTIKFTDGANTKVSTVTSKDGVHELHVDVTGLPVTYTATKTDAQGNVVGNPVNVSKVGDTYQDAAGNKLIKVGDKYYRPDQLVDPNVPNPKVKDAEKANGLTITDSISLVNNDGTTNPTTLKNVDSGLKDANGNATTLDKAVGSNAVNVDDLRTLGKAATTEVTGTGAAEVTKVTGANGQNIYNVHVERFMQVAETDVEGNKVVKAADNHYYKEADIKDKTYIDGKWYNNTDIKDKTKIGDKWYNADDVVNGVPKPNATELTVQDTTPNKAVGLQNNLVNPNDNTPTRLSNLASALSGEVGNGANTEDNSAINGIDKNGKPTSESGNNTFVKNVLDLDATVKTEEQLKTSLGYDPSEDEVKAEKARAEKDKALLNSAVTVADLQKTLQSPLFFEGDSADGVANENGSDKNTFARKLSQKTKIVGGVDLGLKENATADERQKAIADKLTDGNIGVISDGTNTLTIKLAKNLVNLTSVETGSGDNKTKMTENGITTTVKDGNTFKVTTTTPNGLATTEVKLDSEGMPKGESTTTMVTTDGVTITTQTPPDPDGDKPASTTETKLSKDGLATDGTIKVTGDNAKDLVTIGKGTDGSGTDKEYGKIGLDGKNGSKATLTVDRGTKSVTDSANVGKDPTKPIDEDNPVAGMDRLTYTTTGPNNETINHEVATLDDGFFLTTEHTEANKTRTVLFNNTIKVLDGANTKVSAMGGKDGTHTFSIDVTGLPVTYTATKTDANGTPTGEPVDVSKVGNTYQLADGTKLEKVGDKYYTPDQLENGQPKPNAEGLTIKQSVSLVQDNGAPATLERVGSGRRNGMDATADPMAWDKILNPSDADKAKVDDMLTNAANIGDVRDAIKSITDGTSEGAAGGFGLTGNNGKIMQDLGKTITVKGGIANKMDNAGTDLGQPAKSTTDKNTYVNVKDVPNADGKGSHKEMVIEIAKDLTDLDSVTVGSVDPTTGKGETTKITGKDVTIKDKAGNANTSTATKDELTNANGDKTTVEAGKVDVSKKNADGTTSNTNIDGSKITLENKDKDSNTVGSKTDIGTDGIRITYKDDKGKTDPKKDVSLTDKGLNNGGNQIKNVGSGLVNKDGSKITDIAGIKDQDILSNGVNVGDLQKAINSVTNSSNGGGFGLTGNNGDVKQDLGKTITVKGGIANKVDEAGQDLHVPEKSTTDQNTYVNVKDSEMVVEIAKDLIDLDSVTIGNVDKKGNGGTVINKDSMTVKDKDGKNSTNIGTGTIGTSKTDGNGNTSSTNIDGSTITLENKDKDGKLTGPKTEVSNKGITITPVDKDGKPIEGKKVKLSDKGLDNGGNQIKHVDSGLKKENGDSVKLEDAAGDMLNNAVNVGDLKSVNEKLKDDIINISNQVDDIKNSAPVVYLDKEGNRVIRKGNKFVKKNDETAEIPPQDIRLSLVNADGKTTTPSTLQNVAEGVKDTDAVNVKQLTDATEKPLTFNGDAGSSSAKLGETVAIKGGANSADLTDNNIGVIANSSTKTLNVKLSKKLKGLESAEFVDNNGNTTNITGDGVHISGGNGSNVSLTSQGLNNGGNRITNVAPGVEATDAVNVSQLNQVGAALHNRINNVAKGAYGGVASAGAMASLPQAYLPGKSMVAAGASHYRGESAVALGASRISDNGKIILKLNASHNTSGNTMVGAGVGYQF